MNAQNAKDFLPIVQALIEGKQIQCLTTSHTWIDLPDVVFSDPIEKYRIKHEPMEVWVHITSPTEVGFAYTQEEKNRLANHKNLRLFREVL